ncbi:MAG: hypothetical protein WCO93_01995 [bacterium]
MKEQDLQEQMDRLNQKLDLILESVEQQKRNREEFDDLMADASIVAKDAFTQTVTLLDKSQVELDHCGLSCLMVKVLQNLGTFYEMLEMMESARDFMKDVTPILHQVGLDAVNKMNELDQKGYFEYAGQLMKFMDKFIQTFTVQDLRRMQDNLDNMAGIVRNLTQPELIASLNKATKAISEVKMDEKLDDVSLWKILMKMRSPEVRKSLSYSLRLLETINKS